MLWNASSDVMRVWVRFRSHSNCSPSPHQLPILLHGRGVSSHEVARPMGEKLKTLSGVAIVGLRLLIVRAVRHLAWADLAIDP